MDTASTSHRKAPQIPQFIWAIVAVVFVSCNATFDNSDKDRKSEKSQHQTLPKNLERQHDVDFSSPYKFVTSAEECEIFGKLLAASSFAKSVHNDGVTLLCPLNEAFGNVPNWAQMLEVENKADLDAFIEKHVIPEILDFKEFRNGKQLADVNHEPINLDDRKEITEIVANNPFEEVPTSNGLVLKSMNLLVMPELTSKNDPISLR